MIFLLLTVRFLDDRYHGLLDRGGPPEWPPSPFRLFQALVAGMARRGDLVVGDDVPSNTNFTPIAQALGWLQRLTRDRPPIIIAPKSKRGQAITRFVPNNDGDKKFDRQERLTAKHTEPTLFLLERDQKPEVHYVWDIADDRANATLHEQNIERAARSLTALGWGIDMAFADARLADEADLQKLIGVRWYPKKDAGSFHDTLRAPTYDADMGECTLCDLRHCHSTFINRIEQGKPLKTVDKPKVFDRVLYASVERPIGSPNAIFRLLDDDGDAYRYPHARLIHIAGMVRHAAIERMKADPPNSKYDEPAWLETFVCGHRGDAKYHQQLSYIPLPSIGKHADALIRNVMIVAPLGCEQDLDYIATRLDGLPLQPEDEVRSLDLDDPTVSPAKIYLERFTPPHDKFIWRRYLATSRVWQTVTPVILPGHNDKKDDKTRELIQRSLQQAGIETPCEFTWQSVPFFKNCLSAHKYDRDGRHTGYHRPAHLKSQTAVHLQLTFEHEVHGPLTLGAGRHCGFGLMAAVE